MIPWQELAEHEGFETPKEWLECLTHAEDLHQREVAVRVGCDLRTLHRALNRYGVSPKPRGGSRARKVGALQRRILEAPYWRTAPLRTLCECLPGADKANVCTARRALLAKFPLTLDSPTGVL